MKKYITKEELRDVVSELADAFMENTRYDVTISLSHLSSYDDLQVQIQDRQSSWKVISTESYRIIEKTSDAFDVVRDLETAIEKHEAETIKIKQEDESPIEIPCV